MLGNHTNIVDLISPDGTQSTIGLDVNEALAVRGSSFESFSATSNLLDEKLVVIRGVHRINRDGEKRVETTGFAVTDVHTEKPKRLLVSYRPYSEMDWKEVTPNSPNYGRNLRELEEISGLIIGGIVARRKPSGWRGTTLLASAAA